MCCKSSKGERDHISTVTPLNCFAAFNPVMHQTWNIFIYTFTLQTGVIIYFFIVFYLDLHLVTHALKYWRCNWPRGCPDFYWDFGEDCVGNLSTVILSDGKLKSKLQIVIDPYYISLTYLLIFSCPHYASSFVFFTSIFKDFLNSRKSLWLW